MNIRGIELLRYLKLPGPKKEIITRDITSVNLDYLYKGAKRGATVAVFNYQENIDQNPLLEKNIQQYEINKESYFSTAEDLENKLLKQGTKKQDLVFLTHQTYLSEDISYSGRIAINMNNGFGLLMIDAVESLREANTDFNSRFRYQCPIIGGRMFYSREEIILKSFNLPSVIIKNLIRDISLIPGNPHVDFEVYADDGSIFYHDMFLAK
jgi:hypothetical protein